MHRRCLIDVLPPREVGNHLLVLHRRCVPAAVVIVRDLRRAVNVAALVLLDKFAHKLGAGKVAAADGL